MVRDRIGPYRVLDELGSGGMGTVYRADGPDGVVALKVVHEHVATTPGFLDRFLREGRVGRMVAHPNVVATLDGMRRRASLDRARVRRGDRRSAASPTSSSPCPRSCAGTWDARSRRGSRRCTRRGSSTATSSRRMCASTRSQVVKVMDLGIARAADDDQRMTQTGMFVGSVQYAAPGSSSRAAARDSTRAPIFTRWASRSTSSPRACSRSRARTCRPLCATCCTGRRAAAGRGEPAALRVLRGGAADAAREGPREAVRVGGATARCARARRRGRVVARAREGDARGNARAAAPHPPTPSGATSSTTTARYTSPTTAWSAHSTCAATTPYSSTPATPTSKPQSRGGQPNLRVHLPAPMTRQPDEQPQHNYHTGNRG